MSIVYFIMIWTFMLNAGDLLKGRIFEKFNLNFDTQLFHQCFGKVEIWYKIDLFLFSQVQGLLAYFTICHFIIG